MTALLRGERGTVPLVALLVAVVGIVVLGAAGVLAGGTIRAASRLRDEGAALYVAESGVNEALYRLKYQHHPKYEGPLLEERVYPDDPLANPPEPSFTSADGIVGPDASYKVWVWEDPDPSCGNVKHIVAVGRRGKSQRLVRIAAKPKLPPVNLPDVPDEFNMGEWALKGTGKDQVVYIGQPDKNGQPVVTNYVCTKLFTEGSPTLVLLGPVNIYVTGDITFAGTSRLNVVNTGNETNPNWIAGNPVNLLIWVVGEQEINISLEGGAAFYGGIYAPQSKLTMVGNSYLEGGVRVEEFEKDKNATYKYWDFMADLLWPENAQVDYQVVSYE